MLKRSRHTDSAVWRPRISERGLCQRNTRDGSAVRSSSRAVMLSAPVEGLNLGNLEDPAQPGEGRKGILVVQARHDPLPTATFVAFFVTGSSTTGPNAKVPIC